MAKSYYELKEEEERLALMGGGYSPEEEAPIPSSLPSSVEASRQASGSRLNVLGESLAAAKRVEPRSAGEQARIDDINRRNAALTTNARYEAALNGENRGRGVLGFIGRRRLMNKRGEREPGLREMYTEKSRLADEQTVMAERRKGYQAGKVAKAEFLAKYGAEAAQAVTDQENAVTNAATAQDYNVTNDATAQDYEVKNQNREAEDATNRTFLDFRLEGWKTSTEANAGRGSAIAAMNRALDVNDAVNEGELTPLFAKGSSTLKSLGINIDEEGLNAYQEMNQVINALLRTDISVEGARGLTDKDMEVLRQARFDTKMTAKTREKVLRLLIKHEEAGLDNYIDEWDSFTSAQKNMLGGDPAAVRNNRGGYKRRQIARLKEERALLSGRP